MRISDWSSDVCSSDLIPTPFARCCRTMKGSSGSASRRRRSASGWRELKAIEQPVIVVETRHMHSSLSAMRNKTDRNDALGLAQMMRLGWFRMVHVKGIANQRLRTLLSTRKLLKRKLIDLQNQLRRASSRERGRQSD